MQTAYKYIKSFSHGQITVPKEIRDEFALGEEFWLKIYIQEQKIVAEPVEIKKTKEDFKKMLLSLPVIDIDLEEAVRNREQIEKRLKKLKWV